MANKVPSSYVEIMLELDTLTKEYSSLLSDANKARVNVLGCDGGHDKLVKMENQLKALEAPVRGIDDYFNRVEANELMTCLLNAVRSSLQHPSNQA